MKKLALLVLLFGSLIANEKSDFMGIGGGMTQFATASGNNDGTHGSVILGHNYGKTGRLSVSYSYVDSTSTVEKSSVTAVSYDYIVPMLDDSISVYFGPVLGYTSLSDSNLDLSGASYGAEVGAMLYLFGDYDLDFGARYLGVDSELLNHTTMIYFNFNIHFNSQKLFNL